ncbi:MAG: hypothetical protein ACOX18_04025 [Bacillota bacterium]
MRQLTADEFDQLKELLSQPLKINVVHDDGIELLLIQPEVIIEIWGRIAHTLILRPLKLGRIF